jgi:hypothetical protein
VRISPPAACHREYVLALVFGPALSLVLALALPVAGASATAPPSWAPLRAPRLVDYVRPVPGDVLRPFEPAVTRFGPGHRGVDLDHPEGGEVVAAAAGVVRHAGPVAGTVWVSVDHADGITTSYGPLRDLAVRAGNRVSAGSVIGRLAGGGHGDGAGDRGLHWGARRDGTYVDPLSLLGSGPWRPSLIGPGAWRGRDHAVEPYEPWQGTRWRGLGVAPSPAAERPGFAVPPNPNHLVLVRGLSSSSDGLPFEPWHLGYDPRSVTGHSYSGRLPAGGSRSPALDDPSDPWRDQEPYGPADTWRGVEAASLHLREQLRARWAEEPGRAVDLVGYSMGGVVVLHYLTHHHDPYDASLPPIGHVVTLASPLQGSDVAGLGGAVRDHRALAPVVRGLQDRGVLDGVPPLDAQALEDLRPGSELLRSVADGWQAALDADTAGPLAMGTRVLTIAGHRDRVVAAPRTPVPGASADLDAAHDGDVHLHRVLPGAHGSVLETEALREVTWRFLAGQEVVDSAGHLPVAVSRLQSGALRVGEGALRVHDRGSPPWDLAVPGG